MFKSDGVILVQYSSGYNRNIHPYFQVVPAVCYANIIIYYALNCTKWSVSQPQLYLFEKVSISNVCSMY